MWSGAQPAGSTTNLPASLWLPMRGAARALAALRRGLAAAASVQPHAAQGALQRLQLQRGFSSAGSTRPAAGAAAGGGRAQWLAAVAVGLSAGLGVQLYSAQQPAECKAADKKELVSSKDRLIDKEEVAKHRTKETGARAGVGGVPSGGSPVPAKHAERAMCSSVLCIEALRCTCCSLSGPVVAKLVGWFLN